jgi:hypothetical protein
MPLRVQAHRKRHRNYKILQTKACAPSPQPIGGPIPVSKALGPVFGGKATPARWLHLVSGPGFLLEVAGRTSFIHSTGMVRSYSWLRYTVTTSISLKS